MKIFWTLTRRELAAFFFSVTGYVIIAAVTLLSSLCFVLLLTAYSDGRPFTATVMEMFYSTFFFWLCLLLVTPVITMRLFALEKTTGTFETLMTTPVTDLQVVTSKFAAAIIFYMVTWLPTLASFYLVRHFVGQPGALDAGTVGGMYLGIFLTGGLFLSLGCFASAISQSQMASAMISFVLGVSLFSLGFLAKSIPVTAHLQTQVLSYFSLFDQVQDFARGVVDTRTVIFYATATFFFLFLTLRAVESRRWK
jgi:ABC-2 type transport system permease protein